jgi:hypothetical protein
MPKLKIENLEKKITKEMEEKYRPSFEKQSRYLGNGIYNISQYTLYSTDTRELFLMFIACKEEIKFERE